MLIFFKKNLENEEMSLEEIKGILDMINKKYEIKINKERYVIVDIDINNNHLKFISERLAYNKEFGIVIAIEKNIFFKPKKPVRVLPCKNIKETLEFLQKEKIELDIKAETKVKVFQDVIYILMKEVKEKEFEKRHSKNKPGFMPFSLHPRLSKSLFNIARAKPNSKVLDAFCGIGGTAIEGALIGVNTYCLEKYKKVGEKAFINYKYYLKKCDKLIIGDAMKMPFKDSTFNAVVSDLPYGRSTKIDETNRLYEQFIKEMKRVLKKDSLVVIITNIDIEDRIRSELEIVFKTKFYVHSSLTRKLYLLKVK